jgi:GTP-binding protein
LKIQSVQFACSALDPARYPRTPWAEIAVSGRSNVGKSSLLNTLLGIKNFARISKEPGRTRTVNFYRINDRFFMVDLPGYGYARVSAGTRDKWKKVIYEYIETRELLQGVVQLVDSRHPPMRDDLVMIERLLDAKRSFIVAMTKADKIKRSERSGRLRDFASHFDGYSVGRYGAEVSDGGGTPAGESAPVDVPVLFFSSKSGEGRDELWGWIESRIE